ncbi:hypothetical protein I3760_09G052800 [Carya illinoinensis]|nr:hypothetical protein I3760_09G052800 [Carya illinoinensis]KAG2687479.1 hypothetical protein I3760_09G052800 [Carya illinoinensis]
MGSNSEIAIRMRKILIIPIRTCYRSVCSHPFLVGMLCFLLLLYRSFPFVFSLLVSASPVLFCTALLLGTLLSFGQPNLIPEIEKHDDKVSPAHDVASLKARVSGDTTVVVDDERDESFIVERYTGKGRDIVEEAIEGASSEDEVRKVATYDGLVDYVPLIDHSSRVIRLQESIEGTSSVEDKVGKIEIDDGLVNYMPLIDNSSRVIQLQKRATGEVVGYFHGLELERKRGINEENLGIEEVANDGEAIENQGLVVHKGGDEILEVEGNGIKHPGELADARKGDHLDLSANDDEDGDDGSSGLGSDLAESSSPDASMADIIPMLDELHPLLDMEAPAPAPAHMSHDESDVASEHSQESSDVSVESDEESEIHGEVEEDGVDENEDDEEEEARGGKEDESKSAIKWTEDDQKNLMDLGTSELERNQRLENLIARRRARKNMRLMTEKNLIDLDGADLPLNVPPISTARHNPFDLPYDSYDPPGSAPSILLPRRNPFDLPYDPNEEKPDLKGDSFQQEFTTFQQKDALFRRHESFSSGPSGLGGPRQERRASNLRPFFVPERFISEGTSYSSFERQSSEVSESKLSSVPDTESVSSAADQDDRNANEQDFSQETELISSIGHAFDRAERGSQLSVDIDSVEIEPVERRDVGHDEVEITLGQVGNNAKMDSGLSETRGVAIPLELSNSEIHLTSRSNVGHDEAKIILGQAGNHAQMDSSGFSETGEVVIPLELSTSEIHLNTESVEEDYSSTSRFSSMPEIDGNAENKGSTSLEPRGNDIEESGSSMLPSLEEPDFRVQGGEVDDNQHEPVYDSSPPAGEKILHFPSISSEMYNLQAEISKMSSPPVSVATSVPISDKESELYKGKDSSNYGEIDRASLVAHPKDEMEQRFVEVQELGKDDVTQAKSLGVILDEQNGAEYVVELASVKSRSSSPDLGSVAEGMVVYKKESSSHELDQVRSLSIDSEILFGVHQDVHEKLDTVASSYQMASEIPSLVVEDVSVISSGTKPVEWHASGKEETHQLEQDQNSSSSSDYGSVGEELIHKDIVLQLERDQVKSSSFDDAETQVGGQREGGENLDLLASSPHHIPSSEEQWPPMVTEQVILVLSGHSTPETEHMEDQSLNREDIVQFEQDEVHSSGSDAKIDTALHHDLDEDVVSLSYTGQYMLSEEKPQSELKKYVAYADKPRLEASSEDLDKYTESNSIQTESAEVVRITENGDMPEVTDPECKILQNLSSSALDSTQIDFPAESHEYKSPSGGVNLKADILGRNVNEDQTKVSKDLNYSAETYGSLDAVQTISEEAGEIKEIDEELLLELDTVGDFRVKEVVGAPHEINLGDTDFELFPKDSNRLKTQMDLPVLEARSLEEIDLAFKQLHEGADVEEVIFPSMVNDWLLVEESKDHVEPNSNLKVVDTKSLEDNHIALKQVSEANLHVLPEALDLEEKSASVEPYEMGSAKEIESTDVGSGVQGISTVAADKPEHGSDESLRL